jgi:hypothetical protein
MLQPITVWVELPMVQRMGEFVEIVASAGLLCAAMPAASSLQAEVNVADPAATEGLVDAATMDVVHNLRELRCAD